MPRRTQHVATPPPAWPLWGRLVQLFLGLALYGVSQVLLVRARLGLDPWDVLHQGLHRRVGLAVGTWTILVGVVVLLLWIPLRQRPGVGTVANALLIGLVFNVAIDFIPVPHELALRWVYLVAGILATGVATGAYIGAALGPGPRDGLMVGIANRGHSIRVVRTAMELTVLLTGFLMGGVVGPGTALFALTIGPIVHVTIPFFARGVRTREVAVAEAALPLVGPERSEEEVGCASD